MNGKATLKRLEGLAQRRPQDAFAEYERAKLDAMTDEELARNLAVMERALELLRAAGAKL